MTAEEVVTFLRVTPEAVRAHVRRGELHAYRLGNGPRAHIRITPASVASFLRNVPEAKPDGRDG
jgi:helix-turn-helix protein